MNFLAFIPTPFLLQELHRRGAPADASGLPIPPAVMTATRAVADVFRVPVEQLLGASRLAHITKARFAVWLLLSDQGLGHPQIAEAFGRRDPGTIRHGCIRGRRMVSQEKAFARTLLQAMQKMEAMTGEEDVVLAP